MPIYFILFLAGGFSGLLMMGMAVAMFIRAPRFALGWQIALNLFGAVFLGLGLMLMFYSYQMSQVKLSAGG